MLCFRQLLCALATSPHVTILHCSNGHMNSLADPSMYYPASQVLADMYMYTVCSTLTNHDMPSQKCAAVLYNLHHANHSRGNNILNAYIRPRMKIASFIWVQDISVYPAYLKYPCPQETHSAFYTQQNLSCGYINLHSYGRVLSFKMTEV